MCDRFSPIQNVEVYLHMVLATITIEVPTPYKLHTRFLKNLKRGVGIVIKSKETSS